MKKQLSNICNDAVLIDFTERKIVKYAEIAKPESPGALRKPTGTKRFYAAHWPDGKVSDFSAQFPAHHLPPSLIESQYRNRREIHISLLADLYANILGLPARYGRLHD